MKKKILFVIDSLTAAGAEKSLVTFLSLLDYSRFEVDLQLFGYGGEFERYLPETVNLLPPLAYTQFVGKSVSSQLLTFDFQKIVARWRYSWAIRRGHLLHIDKARLYWRYVSPCISKQKEYYDVAVAYAQGVPTLYVVDKIEASKKFAWVNVKYVPEGINYAFMERYYSKINHIVTVSDSAYTEFASAYPQFTGKISIIRDILDARIIERMSEEKPRFNMECDMPSLLTVARLNKPQKGYDISLQACKILHERGVKFRWYALGRGDYRSEMEQYIREHHLEDTFILLGTTPNPYPYMKACTLYVQTSRHEGFGLSIAEARILNKPVVTTEFDAVWNQMVQGENGIVVPQDPVAVADAIEQLLGDKDLYNHIVAYQRQEKKGNTEEIEKFYQLIEK
ncbi:MAG: glycosyltransferase [Prevotella sp.]|nr:glycosyltransferase [Prevotella sp.]